MFLNPILLFFLISFVLSILIYKFLTNKLHDYLRSAHHVKYHEIYPAVFLSEIKFILSDNDLGDDRVAMFKKRCKNSFFISLLLFIIVFFLFFISNF